MAARDAFLAITLFALDVALIQLTTVWLWRHASRQGLINPMLDPRTDGESGGAREVVSKIPTWPWVTGTLTVFLSAFLLPLAAGLIVGLLERYVF
jgi:hypothetical protein